MADPSELTRLLRAFRSAPHPLGRLKLLARGAAVLKKLSPRDRRALLSRLGLREAESLLDRFGGDLGPATRHALQHAFDELESDPRRVEELGRALVDPQRREETIRGLLAHLEEAAAGEEAEGNAEEAREEAREVAREVERPLPAPAPAAAPVAAVPGEDRWRREREDLPPVPSTADRASSATAAGPTAPEPLPESAAAPSKSSLVPPPAAEAPAAPPRPRLPPRPGAALRELRRCLATGFLPADLGAWLERSFAPGWPRRRALQALFESGRPPEVEEALELVRHLPSAGDRGWCLTALAGSRAWGESEWCVLLAATETPALRRRLELRRRGARGAEEAPTAALARDPGD